VDKNLAQARRRPRTGRGHAVSNTFVASEMMPGWLGVISEWNPLSAIVAATRELFGNPG
jgi:hypothetical protein